MEVAPSGAFFFSVRVHLPPRRKPGRSKIDNLPEIAEHDLIAIIDGALNENVAQAAKAVLRYKRCASLRGATAGTDYSLGWIRSLISDVRSRGAEALVVRQYRSAKERSHQRDRIAARNVGARASPRATGAAAHAAKRK